MHLAAYVANLVPLLGLNVAIALIKPIVPIEIKSSVSFPVLLYFFTICATNLKFLSINTFLAFSSPWE